MDFWRIAMRPGKPLLFGRIGATPVLGLPGNPVSSLVCATLFLRPAIAVMLGRDQGRDGAGAPSETAILGGPLGANDKRQDYLRARIEIDREGRRVAWPFERQDSSMLATLAQADCLVVRAPHAPAAEAGEAVEIVPLSGGVLNI
jgi:molybdopterin molybdotransferase